MGCKINIRMWKKVQVSQCNDYKNWLGFKCRSYTSIFPFQKLLFCTLGNMGSKSFGKQIPENENDVEGCSAMQEDKQDDEENIGNLI